MTQDQWVIEQEQEFMEIHLSKCCSSEIVPYWITNTTICMGCWKLNTEIGFTLYECSICLTECETKECNCYLK